MSVTSSLGGSSFVVSGPGVQGVSVPELSGVIVASTGPIGPKGDVGPASTVPGPKGDVGPVGPRGPAGVDAAGAMSVDGLGALVHSAPVVTALVDADEFVVAGSADSFKAKRLSWASLKAAFKSWWSVEPATLANKTLSAPVLNAATLKAAVPGPGAVVATLGVAQVRSDGNNVGLGNHAQEALTSGTFNTALGADAQRALTSGTNNTALGTGAQRALTTGTNNTASGDAAQRALTTGSDNTALGATAQRALTTGTSNTALGAGAQYAPLGLYQNPTIPDFPTTTARNQTSVGMESGQNVTAQIDGITTVGWRATAGAVNGTALGMMSRADHANSVALGDNTATTADNQVAVGPRDIEISNATKGVVLKSPDGKRWRITVNNSGVLAATAVT